MNTKNARGNGNTQVGQNLSNEKIRIDHCTINIHLRNRHDFDNFKHLIQKFTFKKQPNENT